MDSTIKLYSLPFTRSRAFMVTGMMVTGNILFPALCHLVPQGGAIFLPIYFFTLLGAYKYGWKVGLLIALLSPLANNLLTGMPPAGVLPAILLKSALLALAAAMAARKFGKVSLPILAGVVLAYQIVGTGFEWIQTGSLYTALQDFRLAVPGMLLQVFGVMAIMKAAARYGY